MRVRTWMVLAISLGLGACVSPNFNYAPEIQAPATSSPTSPHTAIYSEPPTDPKGQVRIGSEGVVDLRPKGERTRIPALHIRMKIQNTNAPTSWTFDSREQSVSFGSHGEVHPTYANSDSASLPNLEIKPGEMRAVDLYFALPTRLGAAEDLPEFEVHWKVGAGPQTFSGQTSFSRIHVPPPPVSSNAAPVDPYPIGYGPYWWDAWGPPVIVGSPIRVRQ